MKHRRSFSETQREALVTNLKNQDVQWTMTIPTAAANFCGKRITLSVLKAYPVSKSYPHAPLSNDEIMLLKLILAKLPAIIALIEERFASGITPNEPTFIAHADKPTIWISRNDQLDKGNDWWTFCVGRDDDSEPQWYFDFKGLQLIDAYHVR